MRYFKQGFEKRGSVTKIALGLGTIVNAASTIHDAVSIGGKAAKGVSSIKNALPKTPTRFFTGGA